MCTAIRFKTDDCYFGRTLDVERPYGECVTVTPRGFVFDFRKMGRLATKHALIGMAAVADGYPLYFDAANEAGLAMAGLNFPKSACWFPPKEGADNLSPFELIPWVLSNCESLKDAKKLLTSLNLCTINFNDSLPLSPLHWIIADREGAISVESVADGLKVYENAIGVLTNEPPFDYHMTHLCDYMGLSENPPQNAAWLPDDKPYSRGMGAMGLPGDLSSASRFVRAAFVKLNSVTEAGEEASVGQFFHILGSVAQPRGCVRLEDGSLEMTAYTSCINLDKGIYYYTTYQNSCVSAVELKKYRDKDALSLFPTVKNMILNKQNLD
ncbi:MAG: choloylglycine hydrolase [Clostridia bacterium]|nr:choloylglycine hydrolase [Clostridia bacterium]